MSLQTGVFEPIDLKALKQKDKYDFTQLVDLYSDQIYRLTLKMVGNERDAEDVLQETFVKAYTNIEGFKGHSKVATWLYRIAVNEALMLLRKRKKESSVLRTESTPPTVMCYPGKSSIGAVYLKKN